MSKKEPKEIILHTRITRSCFDLLSDMQQRKQKVNKHYISKSDIVEDALRFADGQINYQSNEKKD